MIPQDRDGSCVGEAGDNCKCGHPRYRHGNAGCYYDFSLSDSVIDLCDCEKFETKPAPRPGGIEG